MARYHLSNDGTPRVCSAKVSCPLGDSTIHYENKAAAIKGAEERFSQQVDVTKSSASKASRTKKKEDFTIPPTIPQEAYLGRTGFLGGNLARLMKENNERYVGEKVIAENVRNDIKKAISAGFLPKNIDGSEVKYSVRSKDNSIYVKATLEGDEMNSSKFVVNDSSRHYNMRFIELTPLSEQERKETGEVKEKLGKILESYRYDRSNSMVDYFDTNFYPKVDVSKKEHWEVAEKESKKLTLALRNELVEYSKNDPSWRPEINAKTRLLSDKTINEALIRNPKVNDTVISFVGNKQKYETQTDMKWEANRLTSHIDEYSGEKEKAYNAKKLNDSWNERKHTLNSQLSAFEDHTKRRNFATIEEIEQVSPSAAREIRRRLTESFKRTKRTKRTRR